MSIVRPLEWEQEDGLWLANSIAGQYGIWLRGTEWRWTFRPSHKTRASVSSSLEIAKAECESHHQELISSALALPPAASGEAIAASVGMQQAEDFLDIAAIRTKHPWINAIWGETPPASSAEEGKGVLGTVRLVDGGQLKPRANALDEDDAPAFAVSGPGEEVRLANHITAAIFAVGDEPGRKTTRIQFKSGKWPDEEKDGGGLCESALQNVIISAIRDYRDL